MNSKGDGLTNTCEMCQYASFAATFYCEQCSQRLCNTCVKLHNNMKLLAGHNILKIDETSLEYDYAYADEELCSTLHAQRLDDQQNGRGVDQSQQHVRKEKSQKEVVHMYDEIEEPKTKEEQRVTSETVYEDLNKEASGEAVEHMYGRTDVAKLESPHVQAKRFMVTVEPCALAKLCDIEGEMTMLVTNQRISFEDPRTRQNKYVFKVRWIRRFGQKINDRFYFECGRICPNGEGIVTCITTSASEIHGLIKEIQLKITDVPARRFRVTVEPCALAILCDIEGEMTMLVTNQRISFEDPRTRQNKYVFKVRWMRRFGKKSNDRFYFECGRLCPNGVGIVTCITTSATEIHGLIKEIKLKMTQKINP